MSSNGLKDACATRASDVSARYRGPFGAAQTAPPAQSQSGLLDRSDFFARSFCQRRDDRRNRARHRATATTESAIRTAWLDVVLRTYEGRILPVDITVARRWGRLSQQIGNRGLDLAIAATALEHGLTVVTRNVSDFERTGVSVLDPFVSRTRPK